MKVYIYEGNGVYLAATIVVVAKDIDEANGLISTKLEEFGLQMEGTTKEHKIKGAEIIFADSGDY